MSISLVVLVPQQTVSRLLLRVRATDLDAVMNPCTVRAYLTLQVKLNCSGTAVSGASV